MPSGSTSRGHARPTFTTTGKVANLLAAQAQDASRARRGGDMTAPSLGIIADDLSGAAECASHALVARFAQHSVATRLLRSSHAAGADVAEDVHPVVVTVDTDSRRLRRDAGAGAVRAAAALVAARPGRRQEGRLAAARARRRRGRRPRRRAAAHAGRGRRQPRARARRARRRAPRRRHAPARAPTCGPSRRPPAPARVAEALHPLPTVLVPHTTVAARRRGRRRGPRRGRRRRRARRRVRRRDRRRPRRRPRGRRRPRAPPAGAARSSSAPARWPTRPCAPSAEHTAPPARSGARRRTI